MGSPWCCACEYRGARRCRVTARPHPTPHLSRCPEVPFDVRSPGARRPQLCIQRRSPGPLRSTAQTKTTAARPPPARRGLPVCRREGGGNLRSSAGYSFLLGTCRKAVRGPESWRPDRPGEDEERGECCRVGKPQVPKSREPKRARGERHEGARGGSLTGERGFSLSPKSYRSLRTVQASSLKATRRLDNLLVVLYPEAGRP